MEWKLDLIDVFVFVYIKLSVVFLSSVILEQASVTRHVLPRTILRMA
jgi:hypothetical protein